MSIKETKTYTKAQEVERAYDEVQWDGIHSEGCYRCAIATAHDLGGIETFNSNDENSMWSFAPTRVFEFDDGSCAEVTYGSVFVE